MRTIQAGETTLYVLQRLYYEKNRTKVSGKQLTALDHLFQIFLWVLKDNKRTIAFYRGFYFDGQEKILELESL